MKAKEYKINKKVCEADKKDKDRHANYISLRSLLSFLPPWERCRRREGEREGGKEGRRKGGKEGRKDAAGKGA